MRSVIYVLISLLLLISKVSSIRFYLEPNTQKCLRDEILGNVIVYVEYEVSPAPGQKVDYVVKDTRGHTPSQKHDIPHGKLSKFSYSTDVHDVYEICFISHVPSDHQGIKQEVRLVTKTGVEAKNYDSIAEAGKLKPIEVELKKLEDFSVEIVQGFAEMRKNEEEMRDTNEATNARVFYFSIFSLCCVIGLSTWQAIYLRRYFKAKKLIE